METKVEQSAAEIRTARDTPLRTPAATSAGAPSARPLHHSIARSDLRRKLTTAERAVQAVRSHHRVWVQQGSGAPATLLAALAARAEELRDVEVCHMLTLGPLGHLHAEVAGHLRHNALFIGENARAAVATGRADYTPVALGDVERLFTDSLPIDVAFVQTSPPDEHGFLSLGTGPDCTLTAARHARYVIAEMNERMPRALGDTFLHIRQMSAIVPVSRPLLELGQPPVDPVQAKVAEHVAELVPDGSTLQLGIGAIPNEVLARLGDRKDLGVHTELCGDGLVPLIEAGVITGARKRLHPGKVVSGIVLGSHVILDYVDNNPMFEFHPTSYVNDPFVIAQNNAMVAINSAIQVDLTGQICADSIGLMPFSGVGGQPDFVRGAARSEGGISIIALPSTARRGAVSRIVPVLDPGAGVVCTRADVDSVITEYGVARLRGRTLRQRAEALISIAHPSFRDELWNFAVQNHHLEARGARA